MVEKWGSALLCSEFWLVADDPALEEASLPAFSLAVQVAYQENFTISVTANCSPSAAETELIVTPISFLCTFYCSGLNIE